MVAAALLLTGCASTHTAISDDEYLDAVSGLSSYAHMSDAELTRYGEDYCDFLTEFGKGTADGRRDAASQFLAADASQGGDVAETAVAAGSAVQRFCPEYRTD